MTNRLARGSAVGVGFSRIDAKQEATPMGSLAADRPAWTIARSEETVLPLVTRIVAVAVPCRDGRDCAECRIRSPSGRDV
jgi:hypothetical protein